MENTNTRASPLSSQEHELVKKIQLHNVLNRETLSPFSYEEFRSFLQLEHAEENLEFWENIQDYHREAGVYYHAGGILAQARAPRPDAILVPTGMQARRSSRPRRISCGATDAASFLDRPFNKDGEQGPFTNLPLPSPPTGFTVKPRESSFGTKRMSLSISDVRSLWVPRVKVVIDKTTNNPLAELVYDEYLETMVEPKTNLSANNVSRTESEIERDDARDEARCKLRAELGIIILMFFSEESDREINVPAKLKRELLLEINERENYHPNIFKPIIENLYCSKGKKN
ncbi:hypothetical protein M427DRAFT_36596 [Gonapodya prolifera JEL478]|uniref:RGS domain-containing protein n=1 Tax=Gonapodya prolifera (strain JEL478) TaxID=1344416 RepID=A0A139A262_GONPJ|nr:hypothetical protein M427DRAFT_36596 [Gonapodya prolifera JEL478]|eukprot:KXS10779.1 hypothetical protein M427DRAFT_36596 [Gonapodya prolifera JEL478]